MSTALLIPRARSISQTLGSKARSIITILKEKRGRGMGKGGLWGRLHTVPTASPSPSSPWLPRLGYCSPTYATKSP